MARGGTHTLEREDATRQPGLSRVCRPDPLITRPACLALLAAILVIAGAGCGGGTAERTVKPKPVVGEPGFLYRVHGNLIYLECTGKGSPPVVLEAGLGFDHRVWDSIAPDLAGTTRTCSYDRSPLFFSQNGSKRATAQAKVDDLRDLLDMADVERPYVLVGHSYGGVLVRLYAAEHRDDVAGLVLIDSSSPDQVRRYRAAVPPRRPDENPELTLLRASLQDTRNDEGADIEKSFEQARGSSIAELPLIVVTAGRDDSPFSPLRARFARIWLSLQSELARLSPNAIHVIATNSGHFVMSLDGQPDLVVRAIREVVAAARDDRNLGKCEIVFPSQDRKCLRSP
jgi:pimeloyl-ACP methyl ester carboxylesterase